jgi:hypothetical protein
VVILQARERVNWKGRLQGQHRTLQCAPTGFGCLFHRWELPGSPGIIRGSMHQSGLYSRHDWCPCRFCNLCLQPAAAAAQAALPAADKRRLRLLQFCGWLLMHCGVSTAIQLNKEHVSEPCREQHVPRCVAAARSGLLTHLLDS